MTIALNPIGVAVPFFFVLMAGEYFVSKRKKRDVYRLNDTLSNLGCGVGDQSIGLLAKLFKVSIYAFVAEHFALLSWPEDTLWMWVLGFVGVDFFFYWYHRFSHRVNFAWATHEVHHQSEDYNFAVALRQPWFAQFYAWVFYLPLAILGVPTLVYVVSISLNLLYQFLLHTRLIGSLGIFEWLMNTPSHHRVHHGINEKYLDKNYAGVFIIWDRLFGTFQIEEEEPQYGVLKPRPSWNPLRVNVEPLISLAIRSMRTEGALNKLWIWFAPPAWTPGVGEVLPAFPPEDRGYNRDYPPMHAYLLTQLFPLVIGMTWVLLFETQLEQVLKVFIVSFLIFSMVSWSGLIEGRRGAYRAELFRLGLSSACTLYISYFSPTEVMLTCATLNLILNGVSLFWLIKVWGTGAPSSAQVL
jgi:alkylglycerol monooxygenase